MRLTKKYVCVLQYFHRCLSVHKGDRHFGLTSMAAQTKIQKIKTEKLTYPITNWHSERRVLQLLHRHYFVPEMLQNRICP